jgi:hypothetical protein
MTALSPRGTAAAYVSAVPPVEAPADLAAGDVSLDGLVRICGKKCRAKPAALRFKLSAGAPVVVALARRTCPPGHDCTYRWAAKRTVKGRAGVQRMPVARTVAGMRLRTGRWRLTLAVAQTHRSVQFTVRRGEEAAEEPEPGGAATAAGRARQIRGHGRRSSPTDLVYKPKTTEIGGGGTEEPVDGRAGSVHPLRPAIHCRCPNGELLRLRPRSGKRLSSRATSRHSSLLHTDQTTCGRLIRRARGVQPAMVRTFSAERPTARPIVPRR